jgi:hypothetical protein
MLLPEFLMPDCSYGHGNTACSPQDIRQAIYVYLTIIQSLALVIGIGLSAAGVWAIRRTYQDGKLDAKNSQRISLHAESSKLYNSLHLEMLRDRSSLAFAKSFAYGRKANQSEDEARVCATGYLWLNALHYEWSMVEDLGHPLESFLKSVERTLWRFFDNPPEEFEYVKVQFRELFSDYPQRFISILDADAEKRSRLWAYAIEQRQRIDQAKKAADRRSRFLRRWPRGDALHGFPEL